MNADSRGITFYLLPTQMRSARRSLLQDIELMSQYEDLGFQLLSRPEAVAQQADE